MVDRKSHQTGGHFFVYQLKTINQLGIRGRTRTG
jgi:hypothetical protein